VEKFPRKNSKNLKEKLTESGLFYRVFEPGDGGADAPPLVLLHGNGEDGSIFAGFETLFPGRYVIVPDTRGHGRSGGDISRADFYMLADDLAAVLRDFGAERADMAGFSDGGNTVLHLCLKYPDKVRRAAVIGANINPRGVAFGYRLGIWLSFNYYKVANKKREADLFRLMQKEPHLSYADLRAIKARVLVMAGDRDMIKSKHTVSIANNIPDARIAIFKGDHFFLFSGGEGKAALRDFFGE